MLETCIVRGVRADSISKADVAREFRELVDAGARICPSGSAKSRPRSLLTRGYVPQYRIRLFDTRLWLAEIRQEPNARFFITYVMLDAQRDLPPRRRRLHTRYFYKDASLVWRSASHFARSASENWIGKGDVKPVLEDGEERLYTAEETTNLPLEIQPALDLMSRAAENIVRDDKAIGLVLRRAPDHRVEPYAEFTTPRRRAAADPTNLVNGGEPVAWFTRKNDPSSLRFARGYEPDFRGGILEVDPETSRLYGGTLRKFRVLSKNRKIQYQLVAAPQHVWVVPPQALTTQLSSFALRTIDVEADDQLFVPGWEYHYLDDWQDPPQIYSQIPEGWAGVQSTVDPARADASPWLEELPVLQEFRQAIGLPRPRGKNAPSPPRKEARTKR